MRTCWMAAGAKDWLNVDKLRPLKDRKIILYPDTSTSGGAFQRWSKIAKEAKQLGYNISVSTMLEDKCTDEQKAKGYDLGDYLIDKLTKPLPTQQNEEQRQSTILSDMIKENPALATLIDSFDCVEV